MHATPTDERLCTEDAREMLERYARERTPELLDALVARHMQLARQLARRFADRGESLEDLQQVASLGLVKAIQAYQPELGHHFTTYAVPTILGEIKRWFRDKGWALRVPRRLQELGMSVRRTNEALTQSLGHSPTITQVASVLEVTVEQVAEALESTQHYRALSMEGLQSTQGDEDDRLPISIGRPDPDLVSADLRISLESACARLPQREQDVVRMRFVEGLSQAQVARRLRLSQMHISRLQARALLSLRKCLECV